MVDCTGDEIPQSVIDEAETEVVDDGLDSDFGEQDAEAAAPVPEANVRNESEPPANPRGDNWKPWPSSFLQRSLSIVGILITISCDQGDVDIRMHDVMCQTFTAPEQEDLTYWFVAYERGTLNQGGHLHFLMEGPMACDKSGLTKMSHWTRKLLDLSNQWVNGVKMVYKVHVKALLSATQTSELTSAYLAKDIGQFHSKIAMGGPKANPEDFSMWAIKYRQINADLFKSRVVLDWGIMTKHVHAFYNSHVFPLAVTYLTIVWLMLCSGDMSII